MPDDDLLTIEECRVLTRLSETAIRAAIKRGTLPAVVPEPAIMVRRQDLFAYLRRTHGRPGRPRKAKPEETTP